jgi:AbrB family looped-hinge helix DNA binding protein
MRKPRGSYILRIHSGGRVVIPAEVRHYFGLEPGKKVRFTVRRNTIYLSKA